MTKGLSSAHLSGCPHSLHCLLVSPGPHAHQASAPCRALGILPKSWREPLLHFCPVPRLTGREGTWNTGHDPQLCPLPCQTPCPVDAELQPWGRQAFGLPSDRDGTLSSCFIWVSPTPQPHAPYLPLFPLACFTCPVPLPTCQVSLGDPAEAGCSCWVGPGKASGACCCLPAVGTARPVPSNSCNFHGL